MKFFHPPDWDQKLFDKLVEFGGRAIDSGYAKAWFTWLEWVGLTALLFLAHKKANSSIALIAAYTSVLLLFFVALAVVRREIDKFTESSKLGLWLSLAVILVVSFATPFVVMAIIEGVLESTGA